MKTINKHGWVTRDFVVAALLFSGMVALFVLAIAGIADKYDNTEIVSESFSENYDKLTETAEKINIGRNSTTSGSGLSFLGTFDVAFQSTFTIIQLVFSTLSLYGNLAGNIITDFTFLDATVVKIFFIIGLAALTAYLVFIWISSISRGKI